MKWIQVPTVAATLVSLLSGCGGGLSGAGGGGGEGGSTSGGIGGAGGGRMSGAGGAGGVSGTTSAASTTVASSNASSTSDSSSSASSTSAASSGVSAGDSSSSVSSSSASGSGSTSSSSAASSSAASSSAASSSASSGSGGGMPAGPYGWKNATFLGGGFVSGIVFSPVQKDLIYARTDIGGFYRWDQTTTSWVPLTDGLPYNQMGGESLAADPVNGNIVYAAGGMYLQSGNGAILRSTDKGDTWTSNPIAVPMGGNADGRSMGERLAVDPKNTSKLYFGSRTQGLWVSTNAASTWSHVASFPVNGDANLGLSFVLFNPLTAAVGGVSSTVFVGVASTAAGSNLYRTTNGGTSWALVPGGPTGLMPHHAALGSNGIMYLAYNNGPGPNGITQGAVWKLDTASGVWTSITPPSGAGGFGGVTVDATNPNMVIAATLDWWNPDEIYRSTNAGASWTAIGRNAQHSTNGAQYLCFGPPGCANPSSAGWMGDIKIDPFSSGHVLFVTGQGTWGSDNATNATVGQIVWSFRDKNLEETAVIDMTSSVKGALLSAVGDIGGSRHIDLTQPPPLGMYTNPVFGNTTGIDFAGQNSQIVARVGTSGGAQHGAYSINNAQAWTPFASEPAGSTGQGSIAVSASGGTFVWAPSNASPAYSQDHGATWKASTGLPNNVLVASDRVNSNKFYAYSGGKLYVSTNGGVSFAAGASGLAGNGRARAVFGVEGDVWVATGSGLYHSTNSGATAPKVSSVQSATAVGFGAAAPGKSYPAVYLIGQVNNVTGFFRSDDAGATWTRINDPSHQFGAAGQVAGDEGIYGRVYIGTNGRGIVYGDPGP